MSLALLGAAAALAALASRSRPGWHVPRGQPGLDRLTRLLLAAGKRAAPVLRLVPAPPLAEVTRLPERAGRPAGVTDADLPALRAGALAVFGAFGALALVLVGGAVGLVAAFALIGFGWLYPELWLRSLAARRVERIERRAPLALDVVAASVAAGVGVDQALAGAATAVDGPLRDELGRTQANLALGRLRAEEFRDLGDRSGSPTLVRLAAALIASDRLGVPLADSLRAEATRARRDRALAVQERAAKAGPRILLVVVFVLVPASMLPLVAAVALGALKAVSGLDL